MPIDSHVAGIAAGGHWGLLPTIQVGAWPISMYSLLVGLGLLVGAAWYFWSARVQTPERGQARQKGNGVIIFVAVFGGSMLGAKLPMLVVQMVQSSRDSGWVQLVESGRTVVGGLIGGMLAVLLVKKIFGIRERLGNHIAPAAALGIAIGRLGCLCAGCCYGQPTGIAGFGIDFGDGILRHPTQFYESIWDFALFGLLLILGRKPARPGFNFRLFVILYLGMRFLFEFIRVEPKVLWGLTGFQLAAAVGVGMAILGLRKILREPAPQVSHMRDWRRPRCEEETEARNGVWRKPHEYRSEVDDEAGRDAGSSEKEADNG